MEQVKTPVELQWKAVGLSKTPVEFQLDLGSFLIRRQIYNCTPTFLRFELYTFDMTFDSRAAQQFADCVTTE